jgi:RNA polymerase sigma factor (sigma-70 family)
MYSSSVRRTSSEALLSPPLQKVANSARFEGVVLPHLEDAYSLACWITGNRADAEDVVQDACLHASRGIRGFSNGNARAWLLTIVRNTAYSWLRKNRPTADLVLKDIEGDEAVLRDSADPDRAPQEASLIAKAGATTLHRAIAALPTPYRETMILRDVQGLSYREIAEITAVPTGTVMSRLARARRRIIADLTKRDVTQLMPRQVGCLAVQRDTFGHK